MAAARWLLPPPGGPNRIQIGTLLEPAVTGGERHDLRFGDHRDRLEVEVRQCLARRQLSLREVTFDAASSPVGQFLLDEGGQRIGRRPSFLIRLPGELRPYGLDGRQAQLREHDREPGGVDLRALAAHAPPLTTTVAGKDCRAASDASNASAGISAENSITSSRTGAAPLVRAKANAIAPSTRIGGISRD